MVTQFLDLLQAQLGAAAEPKATAYLERALTGATRMHRLLDDLLRIPILERDAVACETFAAGVAVDEVIESLEPHMREVDGEVVVGFLPTVVAERTGFILVMQNLLANAITYRQSDRPLRIIIRGEETPGEWIIAVEDNGMGFAMEQAESIFLIFKRRHGSDIAGTGVGLAISRKIVARWHGRIWAESRLGQGSTFHIPLLHSQAGPSMIRIFVVDDNPANIYLITIALEMLDKELSVIPCLPHADPVGLLTAQAQADDIILIDLNMPGLDGCTVLERVTRARPDLSRIAILIGSANPADGNGGWRSARGPFCASRTASPTGRTC